MDATRLAAAAALLLAAGSAGAADVTVKVSGVRSGDGTVLVALCTASTFLGRACEATGSAEARPGVTEVVIRGVPPGVYAAQALHDENDNADLDRDGLGLPIEGFGFSRNAPLRIGPPRFSEAAVQVPSRGGVLRFAMRYF